MSVCESCVVPFVLLIHGNHGAATQWTHLEAAVRRALPNAIVFASRCSERLRTHAGLRVLGDRLVDEVRQFREGHAQGNVDCRLVVVCHSLGGLIGRQALPGLLQLPGIQPGLYYSISTPHLGSRRPPEGLPGRVMRSLVHGMINTVYGLTGQELLLQDSHSGTTQLSNLSDPDGDYHRAWSLFQVTLVSIPRRDLIVPYPSSSGRLRNPYPSTQSFQHWRRSFYVAGYDGFRDCHSGWLSTWAATLPNGDAPVVDLHVDNVEASKAVGALYVTDDCGDVETLPDVHRAVEALPYLRRLDVQFNYVSRLLTHDAPLKRGAWADLGRGSQHFLDAFVELVALDLDVTMGRPAN